MADLPQVDFPVVLRRANVAREFQLPNGNFIQVISAQEMAKKFTPSKDAEIPSDEEEIELTSSGEATVVPKESLPIPPPTKRIHPRRPLPPVPEAPAE